MPHRRYLRRWGLLRADGLPDLPGLQRRRERRSLRNDSRLRLRPLGLTLTLALHLLSAGFMKKTMRPKGECSRDDVMSRYAAGNDAMFPELYRLVTPALARFVDRRLANKARLPDIVQETMLRVHRSRASFARGSAVMPWILSIARRQLVDEYRRDARERKLRVGSTHQLAARAAPATPPSAEEVIVAKQTVERLDRALATVPEAQRAAMRLVRGEGLSHADAARSLGTSALGVRLRTHRACRALREALSEAGPTPPQLPLLAGARPERFVQRR